MGTFPAHWRLRESKAQPAIALRGCQAYADRQLKIEAGNAGRHLPLARPRMTTSEVPQVLYVS
jgi:hypothetical protein